MNRRRLVLTMLGLLLATGGLRAEAAFLVAVFGSQRPDINAPSLAHSFAVFAKVSRDHPGGPIRVETTEISWLAATAHVRVLWPFPEPGHNFDLRTTLQLAEAQGTRVSVWGPYQIERELYERAVAQKSLLESGKVLYKAIDVGLPADRVTNCIRALSRVAPGAPKLRVGAPGWGEPASYYITQAFRPWFVNPDETHDWLLAALGLGDYPFVRRPLDGNPSESALLRWIQEWRNAFLNQPSWLRNEPRPASAWSGTRASSRHIP
jgi:hypothetical protein